MIRVDRRLEGSPLRQSVFGKTRIGHLQHHQRPAMGIERVCGQQFALPLELALANRRQHVGHFSAKDGARDSRKHQLRGLAFVQTLQGVLAKCRDVLPRGGALHRHKGHQRDHPQRSGHGARP